MSGEKGFVMVISKSERGEEKTWAKLGDEAINRMKTWSLVPYQSEKKRADELL